MTGIGLGFVELFPALIVKKWFTNSGLRSNASGVQNIFDPVIFP